MMKKTYKKIESNTDYKVIKNLSKLVTKYFNIALQNNAIETQNSDINIYPESVNLKLRPIVRGPKLPTCKLSKFIELLLKPFLKHIPIYVKDSIDFLNQCKRETKYETYWNFHPPESLILYST